MHLHNLSKIYFNIKLPSTHRFRMWHFLR
jgi:hypothetical protein